MELVTSLIMRGLSKALDISVLFSTDMAFIIIANSVSLSILIRT